MQRLLASLIAIPAFATVLSAQCFEQNFGVLAPNSATGIAGYGDDVFFDIAPMNITFPMAGNSATYTHAHISDNGILYLTNGAATNGPMGAGNGYQNLSVFLGQTAGDDPRIAPLFVDLWCRPQDGGGIFINNTIPGKFVVTWSNMVEWWVTTQAGTPTVFTFQAQLFANGDVIFSYGPSVYGAAYASQLAARVGVSEGNGVADPGNANLSANPSNLTSLALYEEFPVNVFDLADSSVQFVYAGTGYLAVTTPCTPAFHQNYGNGCYEISDSFYEFFGDAALASAGLTGQSMKLTPAGTQYAVTWGGVPYIVPSGSATPVFATPTDDGEAAVTPSVSFPTPSGPQASLLVHSNGIVSWGAGPQTFVGNNYTPSATSFLEAGNSGFWSWHDYNEAEAGSGRIVREQVTVGADTVLVISWHDVDSYPVGVANNSNVQVQLNLSNGEAAIVWDVVDNDITSPFGSAHLIGWSPSAISNDAGSVDLSTVAPFATQPLNIDAMSLSASPAPISSATVGTTVVYTTVDMPAIAPNVYVGLTILSASQNPGLDLGFIGAAGCNAYVNSLDLTLALFGVSSTESVSVILPPGIAPGFEFYAQSIGLVLPNSLPNGQNTFGMTVSNGVITHISNF